MGIRAFAADHAWSQRHLSHYVEGDLRARARRRLDRHALGCADCTRGVLAMRVLAGVAWSLDGLAGTRAPDGIFDRVRTAAGAPSA
jgi:hypothetical protein